MNPSLGDLVRKARLEKGWSQRELARRIQKSPTYIHYLERGFNPSSKNSKFQVGVESVDALVKILGLDGNEARRLAGYAPEYLDGETLEITEGVTIRFEGSQHWSNEERQRAIEAVRTVVAGIKARQNENN